MFGVDLNPVAGELAEVSLWLNCIHKDGHVPWFGYQLVTGNSLVGARRQVYESARLGKGNRRRSERWFNFAPERVRAAAPGHRLPLPPAGPRNGRLPQQGRDALRADSFARIKGWRKAFCQPFAPQTRSASWKPSPPGWTSCGRCTPSSLPATGGRPRTPCPYGGRRIPTPPRRTPNHWKDRIRDQGVFSRGDPHGQPLPPPEARDGLLVRPLVLADWGGRATTDAGRVPERGQPGAQGLDLPAGPGAEPDQGSLRRGVRGARGRDREAHH